MCRASSEIIFCSCAQISDESKRHINYWEYCRNVEDTFVIGEVIAAYQQTFALPSLDDFLSKILHALNKRALFDIPIDYKFGDRLIIHINNLNELSANSSVSLAGAVTDIQPDKAKCPNEIMIVFVYGKEWQLDAQHAHEK